MSESGNRERAVLGSIASTLRDILDDERREKQPIGRFLWLLKLCVERADLALAQPSGDDLSVAFKQGWDAAIASGAVESPHQPPAGGRCLCGLQATAFRPVLDEGFSLPVCDRHKESAQPEPKPKESNPCPVCGAFLWGDTRPCWNCARLRSVTSKIQCSDIPIEVDPTMPLGEIRFKPAAPQPELHEVLRGLIESAVTDADSCVFCRNDVTRHASGCPIPAAAVALKRAADPRESTVAGAAIDARPAAPRLCPFCLFGEPHVKKHALCDGWYRHGGIVERCQCPCVAAAPLVTDAAIDVLARSLMRVLEINGAVYSRSERMRECRAVLVAAFRLAEGKE